MRLGQAHGDGIYDVVVVDDCGIQLIDLGQKCGAYCVGACVVDNQHSGVVHGAVFGDVVGLCDGGVSGCAGRLLSVRRSACAEYCSSGKCDVYCFHTVSVRIVRGMSHRY